MTCDTESQQTAPQPDTPCTSQSAPPAWNGSGACLQAADTSTVASVTISARVAVGFVKTHECCGGKDSR